ncbi:aminoacetone oxidase family FAD-binding enzyme, partial [Herbaspirillum sp. HC18]
HELREAIAAHGIVRLSIDLRPDLSPEDLERRLAGPRNKQSLANFLRKAGRLGPAEIGLLQEIAHADGLRLADIAPAGLAALIKAVPLQLVGTAPMARAISTAGGVAFDEIDAHGMLRRRPGVFVAGEMLDWEA